MSEETFLTQLLSLHDCSCEPKRAISCYLGIRRSIVMSCLNVHESRNRRAWRKRSRTRNRRKVAIRRKNLAGLFLPKASARSSLPNRPRQRRSTTSLIFFLVSESRCFGICIENSLQTPPQRGKHDISDGPTCSLEQQLRSHSTIQGTATLGRDPDSPSTPQQPRCV